jgi:ABC-type bacteriocin transporter
MMKKKVIVKQRDVTDCGAACLASVAAHYGLKISVAKIRQLASTDKKGTNVLGMIQAAGKLGFQARGVKGTAEGLAKIPLPAIAHVVVHDVLQHFVVIYSVAGGKVDVMDPGSGGPRRLSNDEFAKMWTGILILLMPGQVFQAGNKTESVSARFWKLAYPHRRVMIEALCGAVIYTVIGLSMSIYVQKIVDYVLVDGNRNLLNLMSVGMLMLLLVSIFIGSVKSLFMVRTGQMIDASLILGYYKHLLKLPQSFFDSMRIGEILSRINDAVKIRAFINDVSINLGVNILLIIFSTMLMFTFYWKLAVVILMILPLYGIIFLFTNQVNKKVERKLMEKGAALQSQLVESLNSIGTIKSFGLEEHANEKTEIKFYSLLETVYRSTLNSLIPASSIEFTSRLFTILLLWIGCLFVLDRQITAGELLSFYALVGYFTGPAASLIGINKTTQNALIAADRLFEIMDLEKESEEGKIHFSREMNGDIRFVDVSFSYGTRIEVFENLNLTIPKGNVVALVGESGSGKSTMINILQNLYPTASGHISIGDYQLKYLDNTSLRNLIGVVPQKIDLFAGSIVENIAIGDEEPDMRKILNICGELGIRDFIESLPKGFATYLGENGALLSGGQKQRIAIARALYKNPEIVILDEATSSLDSGAERYIRNVIQLLRDQHKTVIIIAHRFSTVVFADKIVVIDKGKVVEEGTHYELVRSNGKYRELWRNQFSTEEVIAGT